MNPKPIPFTPDWPEPETRYFRAELPDPPTLPLTEVFGPIWADWISKSAQSKSAPPDYVAATLLSVAGGLIGNTHWVSPWGDWTEPPIIWTMTIGNPSMNKSPAADAVFGPLRKLEQADRRKAKTEHARWSQEAETAKLYHDNWKRAAKEAMEQGLTPPPKPAEADAGPEPIFHGYVISDATIEKVGSILSDQPRGVILSRDELTGWLQSMTRYSGGGSDRPFWLEAYGGRPYSIERQGRAPCHVPFLSVSVFGGIQPDRLKSLLFRSDDDGLCARFLPVWPAPAPMVRPGDWSGEGFARQAFSRLLALELSFDDTGAPSPKIVALTPKAAELFQEYREKVALWGSDAEGLLASFIGKLPGLALRVGLVLAFLDYARGNQEAPQSIEVETIKRSIDFVEVYALPMARRAYADASLPKVDRSARRLVSILIAEKMKRFTTSDILRKERSGLRTKAEVDPALVALEEASIVKRVEVPTGPKGGAPQRAYTVHPCVWK